MQIELNRFDAETIIDALRVRISWAREHAKSRNTHAAAEMVAAITTWTDIIEMIKEQAKGQGFTVGS